MAAQPPEGSMTRRARQPSREEDKKTEGRWGFDKRVGPATFINLAQLITIVWLGSSFYTQVNDNQTRNEERFKTFEDERKIQSEQMVKMQDAQNQLLVQLTKVGDQQQNTTEYIEELLSVMQNKKP